MQKLYLHIGMPKTGTSALQIFFTKNRGRLYEDGIWYPELGVDVNVEGKPKGFSGNAEFLLGCSVNLEDMSNERRQLFEDTCEKLLNSDEDILLSSEGLFWGNAVVYKNLRVRGFDVKVIVYLRRQDLWGESAWNQNVKGRDCTERCFDYLQKLNLDYYKKLKEIAEVVGKDNVIVSIYESGGGVRRHFHLFSGHIGNP